MAVAEVPGDADEVAQVSATQLGQRLKCCDNSNEPPIVEHQMIAVAQALGAFQVKQELKPARRRHGDAAAMAGVIIQYDGVGDGA